MGKARGTDAKLDRLRLLRDEPGGPVLISELRTALGDKSNLVVAEAAEVVGDRRVTELIPDLVTTFDRFLIDAAETDKLCRAKIAIVEALDKIEYDREEIFRTALSHVQPEGRWGGSDDTAAPLRAAAVCALVRLNPRDLMILLADLLADTEKVARVAAGRALGGSGLFAAIPLLRFKARTGDDESEVVVECLSGLLNLDADGSLGFVAEFLESTTDEIAEGAALALGESRRPEALEALTARWPRVQSDELGKVLLLAIAITRLPAGIEFLLEIVAQKGEAAALDALSALAIHRHNPNIRERIAQAVMKKGTAVQTAFAREFPNDE